MIRLAAVAFASLVLSGLFDPAPEIARATSPEAGAAADGEKDTVIVMHGLGRSNSAMWILAIRLKHAGFHVELVGYDSLDQDPEQILAEVSARIDACCTDLPGTVHFVGHSLGGLMARAYLERHDVANLGRVVLMGTPNQGTVAVDRFRDSWILRLLGPTAEQLGTSDDSFPRTLAPPHYPVGVIAGVYESDFNDDLIPGDDDGLVPVEATKLEGMTDFIVIETSHWGMRNDTQVARQAIAFLRSGAFEHDSLPGQHPISDRIPN